MAHSRFTPHSWFDGRAPALTPAHRVSGGSVIASTESSVLSRRNREGAGWAPSLILFILILLIPVVGTAGGAANDEMRSLDERVQAIKSDVLGIAAELTQLEEKLLYPSDTQVAVFVSLTDGSVGELDSIEIQIDGQPVANHIYSFKEIEALRRGGVQRVYTGNTTTGDHLVEVSVAGTLPSGRVVREQQRFTVEKKVGPTLVSLLLATSETGGVRIELGDG